MIEILVAEMLGSLPFRVCVYIPFLDHLRVPKKALPFIIFLVEAICLTAYGLTLHFTSSVTLAKLMVLPFSCAFFIITKLEFGKKAFIYAFIVNYVFALRGVSLFVEDLFFPENTTDIMRGLLTLVLLLLTAPFIMRYIIRTSPLVFHTDVTEIWNTIWIPPIFVCVIVMLNTLNYDSEHPIIFLITRISLLVGSFVLYNWVIKLIDHYRMKAEADEHIRVLKQISSIQESQYDALRSHIDEIRRIRHDVRQHLRVIMGCIDSNDLGYLREYVQQYSDSVPSDTMCTYCKNAAMDAVLRYYADRALLMEVDYTVSVRMEEKPAIPEHELCVLIGNLLENAVEAASTGTDHRYVSVNIIQNSESMITVTVDNTSPASPVLEDGRYVSTKHEGYGIGTNSIVIIAERYNGDARFEWKDGAFYASVMLNP